ncbi:MAG: 5'-nucleotidase C-terminal domain-containing protein, partial [Vallitaleaceae bacterium]|nr:5'-nucleotidase C-terminal domain-containing protein [Vallitaleaceae bacterium]
LIAEIKAANEVITSEVVASTTVKLLGERGDVRTGQTNLGNLIATSILDATGADLAVTNGGGIRASIEVGDITLGEVITVLPFGNYVVTKEVSGADIKSILEVGISDYPDAKGAFPHVAGVSFTFDPNEPAGSRLVSVKIGGVDIVDTATYVLATNDFLAAGGDGYSALEAYPILGEYSALDEVLVDYINTDGITSAVVDSRITALAINEPEPELISESASYTVVAGDVLWRIARSFDTTWEILWEYNDLANPHLIYVGDIILIP